MNQKSTLVVQQENTPLLTVPNTFTMPQGKPESSDGVVQAQRLMPSLENPGCALLCSLPRVPSDGAMNTQRMPQAHHR